MRQVRAEQLEKRALTQLGEQVMTVPANGSTYIGIVNGLANSKAYDFAITALVGSTESTAVVFGSSVIIGAPTAAQAIKGTVTFPSIPGTNVLYVVAEPQQVGAKAIATRISNRTSPQNFSIPAPPGQYELGAFLDVGNDGSLDPTEPSNFANRTIVTVSSGTDVTGQNCPHLDERRRGVAGLEGRADLAP